MASGLMGSIFAGVPPVTDKATVYASKTGRKFHASESCFSLRRATVHSLTLADAKLAGLTPCGLCYRSETPKGDKAGKQ
jgi:hypothetical protein